MQNKKILISGAGVAGLTLAYFLKQNGFEPVVIERAETLRDDGYMIDFFSSGVSVSEKMEVSNELAIRDVGSNLIIQTTEKGKLNLKLNMRVFRDSLKGKLFNFLRTDLVDILYQKVKSEIEIRFGTTVKTITQNEQGVNIIYENGDTEHFDLLIGADGYNSGTRQKIYDDGEVEKKYLGYYVCAFNHKVTLNLKRTEVSSMICPNKQVMSYATDESNTSLFVFASPKRNILSDKEKIEVLKNEFSGFVNPIPEIIKQGSQKKKLFFDQVSQIKIKSSWHKGRVALIGDAAYCITLLSGQGASMAMMGAYVLSEKLKKYPDNHLKAFSEFENNLRPKVEIMQKKAVKNAATYLPSNNFSLFLRNLFAPLLFTKIFAPLIIKQLGAENYFKRTKNNNGR